jgi:hypothetical protein
MTPDETKKRNERIVQAIDHIFTYASHIDDWIVIKKELMKCLSPSEKILLSTRHPITKKQRTNDLERLLAKFWSSKTKRPVVMPDEHIEEKPQ